MDRVLAPTAAVVLQVNAAVKMATGMCERRRSMTSH